MVPRELLDAGERSPPHSTPRAHPSPPARLARDREWRHRPLAIPRRPRGHRRRTFCVRGRSRPPSHHGGDPSRRRRAPAVGPLPGC